MARAGTRSAVILVVEDDPGDQELIRRSFLDGGSHAELHFANDGEEALDYLLQRNQFSAGTPRPDLVILDLNMPKVDGREVLTAIRRCTELCSLPVVVMTTSQHPKDVEQSYELGANSYITKPAQFERFNDIIKSLELYWLDTVELPGKTLSDE